MTSPSNITSSDRVAPSRKATKAAAPAPKHVWLLPTLLATGTFALAGGGFAAYLLLPGAEETPRQRVSTIKIGPMAEMPDLRDGVPALMSKAHPRAASETGAAQPVPRMAETPMAKPVPVPPAGAENANREAMPSTITGAGLRPALPGREDTASKPKPAAPAPERPATTAALTPPTPREPAAVAAPAPPAEAPPAPLRRVDAKKPVETPAAEPSPASVAAQVAPVPAVAATDPRPAPASPPAQPAISAAEPAEAAEPTPAPVRTASLPAVPPLPPPRPNFQAAEAPASERPARPAERAAAPKPKPAVRQAAASQAGPPAAPTAAPQEERSLLGMPVPGFIPSGRDIRDAAGTIASAVTRPFQ